MIQRKGESAQKPYEPYVPKKLHELNLNIGTSDDISPGGDSGHYNGCAPFNGQLYPSISTTAHLLNGKTIANNHHIPNNSKVDIYLISDPNFT